MNFHKTNNKNEPDELPNTVDAPPPEAIVNLAKEEVILVTVNGFVPVLVITNVLVDTKLVGTLP